MNNKLLSRMCNLHLKTLVVHAETNCVQLRNNKKYVINVLI